MVDQSSQRDPFHLLDVIKDRGVTVVQATPTTYEVCKTVSRYTVEYWSDRIGWIGLDRMDRIGYDEEDWIGCEGCRGAGRRREGKEEWNGGEGKGRKGKAGKVL